MTTPNRPMLVAVIALAMLIGWLIPKFFADTTPEAEVASHSTADGDGDATDPDQFDYTATNRPTGDQQVSGGRQTTQQAGNAIAGFGVEVSPIPFAQSSDYHSLTREFLEAARNGDPDAQYTVAKAIYDCNYFRNIVNYADRWIAQADSQSIVQQYNLDAKEKLAEFCSGFQTEDPQAFAELYREASEFLRQAADNGQPAAAANQLANLARDAAREGNDSEKWQDLDQQALDILASGDPYAVRKLSDYFSMRIQSGASSFQSPGNLSLSSTSQTAKLGFELAGCALGYPCGPNSAHTLGTCLSIGGCNPNWDYQTLLAEARVSPLRFRDALAYRDWILSMIQRGDLSALLDDPAS